MRAASNSLSNCRITAAIVATNSGCDLPITLIGKSHGKSINDSFSELIPSPPCGKPRASQAAHARQLKRTAAAALAGLFLFVEHQHQRIPYPADNTRLRHR